MEKKKRKSQKSETDEDGKSSVYTAVEHYMKTQNRPFNAVAVVVNLGSKYGKTAVQKVINELVENESVIMKPYGKQQLYCWKQSEEEIDQEEIQEKEAYLEKLQKEHREMDQKLRKIVENIKKVEATPTTEGALVSMAEIKKKIEELESEIGPQEEVTEEEKEEIDKKRKQIEAIGKQVKLYRGIVANIVGTVSEAMEISKKQLKILAGIEEEE